MAVIRKSAVIVVGLTMVFGWGLNSVAIAQTSIAFVPGIGFIPSGATMTVTPAVSADRRYVRLSVEPFFNSLNGFTTFSVPGAVSGAGGFGGFGGVNGVMAGVGFGGAGGGMSPGASFGQGGELLAGPVPFGDGLADLGPPLGDPLNPNAAPLSNTGPDLEGLADQDGGVAEPASRRAGDGQGIQAANQQLHRQRRTSARKSSRRRSPTANRRSR